MRMPISYALVLCGLLTCDRTASERISSNHWAALFSSIMLVDTFTNALLRDTASSPTTAHYHPMYIGSPDAAIVLGYSTLDVLHRTQDWGIQYEPDSNDLVLFVDTARTIGAAQSYDWSSGEQQRLGRGGTLSFPVFLQNTSADTLIVGYGEYLQLLLEARDCTGQWAPIQTYYKYGCGTGLPHFVLPPHGLLLTSCPVFTGSYRTQLRLSYGFDSPFRSNVFFGNIDYGQFVAR